MGQVTSACCNPSISVIQLQQSYSQNKSAAIEEPTLDPLEIYSPPNENLIRCLEMASHYRTDNANTLTQSEQQQNLWAIPLKLPSKNKQKQWIYCRGNRHNNALLGELTVYFPSGEIFKGRMKNNQPVYGIFIFRQHCFYVGDIEDLNAEGYGRYQNSDIGYVYEGSWSKSLCHGKGKQFYRNGDKFQGDFIYGAKFGHGVYYFSDGKVYKGSFYNNQNDGFGKMTYPNGSSYEGEWKLGQYHGHGKYIWPNGETYEGQYCQGLRNGKGKYTFKNSKQYQGGWKNGVQCGKGVLRQGFDQIHGTWDDGQLLS